MNDSDYERLKNENSRLLERNERMRQAHVEQVVAIADLTKERNDARQDRDHLRTKITRQRNPVQAEPGRKGMTLDEFAKGPGERNPYICDVLRAADEAFNDDEPEVGGDRPGVKNPRDYRYQVRCTTMEGERIIVGWTDDPTGGGLVKGIDLHPSHSDPVVIDLHGIGEKP